MSGRGDPVKKNIERFRRAVRTTGRVREGFVGNWANKKNNEVNEKERDPGLGSVVLTVCIHNHWEEDSRRKEPRQKHVCLGSTQHHCPGAGGVSGSVLDWRWPGDEDRCARTASPEGEMEKSSALVECFQPFRAVLYRCAWFPFESRDLLKGWQFTLETGFLHFHRRALVIVASILYLFVYTSLSIAHGEVLLEF